MYQAVWDGYHAAQRSERARRRRCRRRCTEYLSFRVQGKIEESLEMLKTTLKLKPDHEKGQAKLKQAKKAEKAKIEVPQRTGAETDPIDRVDHLWRRAARWNGRHSRSKWMTPSRRPRRCKGEESYSARTVPHPLCCMSTLASLARWREHVEPTPKASSEARTAPAGGVVLIRSPRRNLLPGVGRCEPGHAARWKQAARLGAWGEH